MRNFAPFDALTVDKLNEYKVAHRGLKEGEHSFRFMLGRDFFDSFEATEGTEGEVEVEVAIVKHATFTAITARMEGRVKATCDRCLDEMELPLSGKMEFILKQGGRETGNDDDFIVIAPDDDYIDLSVPLYEMYMLNYPLRAVHPPGECNPEMERVLDEFIVEEKTAIDPRWDELKRLINN
jgi:uncharacterized metal-binding protein YceD (DUF177 family)